MIIEDIEIYNLIKDLESDFITIELSQKTKGFIIDVIRELYKIYNKVPFVNPRNNNSLPSVFISINEFNEDGFVEVVVTDFISTITVNKNTQICTKRISNDIDELKEYLCLRK